MESSVSASTQSLGQCAACFTKVTNDDVYCTNCGYPLKGTEFDQRTFIAHRDNLHMDLAEFNKKIKKAGMSLYYLSGVFVIYGIINFFILKNNPNVVAVVIIYLILAILFLVLGAYSVKKPLACIISGLCLYVIVQVLFAIGDPVNIVRGIIFKIAIIGYLIKGIKSVIELEKLKNENNIS